MPALAISSIPTSGMDSTPSPTFSPETLFFEENEEKYPTLLQINPKSVEVHYKIQVFFGL